MFLYLALSATRYYSMHMTRRKRLTTWGIVLLLAAAEISLLLHMERTRQAEEARTVRIASSSSEIMRSRFSPYGPGFGVELVRAFARSYGLKIIRVPISSWEQGWNLLRHGRIDILIGPGLQEPPNPPQSSTQSPPAPFYKAGPTYGASSPVVLHHKRKYGLKDMSTLCSRPVLVQNVQQLPDLLRDVSENAICGPTSSVATALKMPPFLERIQHLEARFGLADERLFSLWQPFYPDIRSTARLEEKIFRRWYWRTDREKLPLVLEAFWADQGRSQSAELGALYFGFLPERTDFYELYRLRKDMRTLLPRYASSIAEAARKYALDPLFLAAVIYQESRFNPRARSKTGVRGLMQITATTAEHLGIGNRLDPIQSLFGGAGYLRDLYDRLDGYGMAPWDRWFTALSAYNQGMGHTRDAIRLAQAQNLDQTRWRNIRKAYKQLSWKRYYSKARHGYARGYEAAHYVRHIRYYYYILRGLAVLAPDEFEHLAALGGSVPAGWPR